MVAAEENVELGHSFYSVFTVRLAVAPRCVHVNLSVKGERLAGTRLQ